MKILILLLGFPIFGISQNLERNKETDVVRSPIISVMTMIEPVNNLMNSESLNSTKNEISHVNTVVAKMEKSYSVISNREKHVVYKVGDVVNNTIVTTMFKCKD